MCVGEVGPGFSFHFSIFFPLIRALLCGRIFSPTTWLGLGWKELLWLPGVTPAYPLVMVSSNHRNCNTNIAEFLNICNIDIPMKRFNDT